MIVPLTQPTLTNVARHAGVSRQSAGQILGGKADLFRPETVRLVQQAAAILGYRPHGVGQALRFGRTNFVGLIQDRYTYRTFLRSELICAIEEQLTVHGRQLVYGSLAENDDPPQLLQRIIADGFLINYHAEVPPALERATAEGRTPAVYLNIRRGSACVYHDETAGAEALTTNCLQRWGSVGWIDQGPATSTDVHAEPHHSIGDRRVGYEHACHAAGIDPRFLRIKFGQGMLSVLEQMTLLLGKPDRPRCLIIGDGFESVGLAYISAARLGLRIPEDLALAGYYSWRSSEMGWQGPMLEQCWDQMAKAAVDMLMKALEDPSQRLPAQAIPLRCIGFA